MIIFGFTLIGIVNELRELYIRISSLNIDRGDEVFLTKATKIINSKKDIFNALTILVYASYLVSFKMKDIRKNIFLMLCFLIYVSLLVADIILFILSSNAFFYVALVFCVFRIVLLYIILQDRTSAVACLVRSEVNDGKTVASNFQGEKEVGILEIKKDKNFKIIFNKMKGFFIRFSIPIFSLITTIVFSQLLFDKSKGAKIVFLILSFLSMLTFIIYTYFSSNKTDVKWINLSSLICLVVGVFCVLVSYVFAYFTYKDWIIILIGSVGVATTGYGSTVMAFRYKYVQNTCLWLRIVVYALSMLLLIYCALCFIFTDIITEQTVFVTPLVFYVSISLIITCGFMQLFLGEKKNIVR